MANASPQIIETVQRWAPGADPGALLRIAERESRFSPTAIGDKTIAPGVFLAQQERIRSEGNPWSETPERWGGSFGLYQMMAPYMVRIWDPKADPYLLFRPDIATVTAGRLWNRAVKLGAKDFVDVRMVWAYGGSRGLEFSKDSPEYQKRLNDKWSVVDGVRNPPVTKFNYAGFGMVPFAGQYDRLTSPIVPVVPANDGVYILIAAAVGLWIVHRRAS